MSQLWAAAEQSELALGQDHFSKTCIQVIYKTGCDWAQQGESSSLRKLQTPQELQLLCTERWKHEPMIRPYCAINWAQYIVGLLSSQVQLWPYFKLWKHLTVWMNLSVTESQKPYFLPVLSEYFSLFQKSTHYLEICVSIWKLDINKYQEIQHFCITGKFWN